MPISFTNLNDIRRHLNGYTEGLDPSYADALVQHTANWNEGVLRQLTEEMERMQREQANTTRRLKKWERDALQQFMDSGITDVLTLKEHDGQLQVWGKNIQDSGKLMFVLDGEKITVHNKRSKHLIPLLTALAEAEGLELEEVDEYPSLDSPTYRVAFWAFKTIKEANDTEIVMQSQPIEPSMREVYVEPDEDTIYWDVTQTWTREPLT